MPVKSLRRLAIESCTHGIKYLYDVGDCPYSVIRPVLLKLGSPQQLHEIEEASPQIAGEDEEIWRSFITRDIPNGETWLKERDARILEEDKEDQADGEYEPRKIPNWWKMYQKLRKRADEKAADHTASLKAVLSQQAAEKERNKAVLDPKLKEPKTIKPPSTNAAPRPQKAVSILEKARRDARGATASRRFVNSPLGMVKQSPGRTVFQSNARPASDRAAHTTAASSSPPSAPLPPVPQTREEAQRRREQALAQASAARGDVRHMPQKRAAPGSSVFMPNKRRVV